MKNFYLLIVLMYAQITFGQIEAGITNPVQNLIIHEDNRDTYFLTNDICNMRIDGWSNTGQVSRITLYRPLGTIPNTSIDDNQGNVQNPNIGSWEKDIYVNPGINNIYVNVRCNYAGCTLVGIDSPIRTFTYVKPYQTGDFYLENTTNGNVKIVMFQDYGIGGLTTGFYYRVFRNTTNTTSGGTYIGSWSQDLEIIDTNVLEGETYYYWVDVAMDNSGLYNSGIVINENRTITTPITLGIETNDIFNALNVYPNPTKNLLTIKSEQQLIGITIYDINGRLLKTISLKNNIRETEIDIRELTHGIYFLKVQTELGTQTKKIIKE